MTGGERDQGQGGVGEKALDCKGLSFYIVFLECEAGRWQSLKCSAGRLGLGLHVCCCLGCVRVKRLYGEVLKHWILKGASGLIFTPLVCHCPASAILVFP